MAKDNRAKNQYRSMRGKVVDMDMLRKRNELTPAVGNAKVNARGDILGAGGKIVKRREDVVKEYCTYHRKTPYTIFRFYNVIGSTVVAPTNPDGLMYNLMKARETGKFTIFGNDYNVSPDGTCVRDYVHVNEICDSLMQAIEKPSNSVESLGHGVGYTVREIVHKFQLVNDVDFDVEYGPRRKGDLASSVLEDVSQYMRNLYTMDELLKV